MLLAVEMQYRLVLRGAYTAASLNYFQPKMGTVLFRFDQADCSLLYLGQQITETRAFTTLSRSMPCRAVNQSI